MLDVWLSEMLGYPVYNSLIPPESDERSLTCAKVPVSDVGTVQRLTELGFRLVEVNVQLGAVGHDMGARYTHHKVVFADPCHHQALLKIAESCFTHSRFHRDGLTLLRANQIKREWVRNCLEGRRGLEVLVALNSYRVTGFLAVGREGNSRTVDLLGVDSKCQRNGFGRALLRSFMTLNPGRTLTAGTSLSNVPSLLLYESCSFKVKSASYVLHLHRGIQ